ncbi:MAG: hypothetical protein ACLQKA_04990 [Bryobacteraceae bacterium]
MTARLEDMTLRHVDPAQLLFQQRHPAFPTAVAEPAWYTNAAPGAVNLAPWVRGTVLAAMHAKVEKGAYFAVVAVLGLYATDEQATDQEAEFSGVVDEQPLKGATPEETLAFQRRVVEDLYPFVRAELHTLTGRLGGVLGVMLQPHPQLYEVPDEQSADNAS